MAPRGAGLGRNAAARNGFECSWGEHDRDQAAVLEDVDTTEGRDVLEKPAEVVLRVARGYFLCHLAILAISSGPAYAPDSQATFGRYDTFGVTSRPHKRIRNGRRCPSALQLLLARGRHFDRVDAQLSTLADRFSSDAGRTRIARAVEELRTTLGTRVSTVQSVREQHGRGEALDAGFPPDAVVWPESTAEVSAIVTLCARHDVPVIAYGAGTSLEGHVSAPYGGVCVDLSRMNQVLAVNTEDSDCVVQPGVTREDLNSWLRDTGFFFPVDPGANATIGGMVSTRASGTTTVRYGAMPQNVLALEVVLANGHVIRCGTRARKSAAGYDLVRLFTGAEGTLGIITEITLRLHAQPEAIGNATCSFPTLRAAVDTVTELSQMGAGLARIEFLDEVQVRACNRHSQLSLPEQPTLFLEFHGTAKGVAEQAAVAESVAAGNGAVGFAFSTQPEQRSQLWRARHAAYFAALALRPGCVAVVADVCVPISALPECVAQTRADIDREGLLAPIVGHVGDGNFHVIFLLDPGSREDRERSDRVYDAMIARAHRAGGTCTGEHGIGLGKREKLLAEVGDDAVDLMHRLKRAWDPQEILNPGKVFKGS